MKELPNVVAPLAGNSRILLILPLAILIGTGSRDCAAQAPGTVRGVVMALETGRPLPDTRVVVVGTDIETVTDSAGSFELTELPFGYVVLQFERVGFARLTELVVFEDAQVATGRFEMPSQTHVLDAIGFTTSSPDEEAGGSRQVVEGEWVQSYHSLERAVDGVSGVQLVRTSGEVGAGYYIRIRGVNSMTFARRPAVFIDGVRLDLTFTSAASSLDLISPSQVGRVEVLRGAAAAARYGPDAANGVILITTKRG